MHYSVLKEEVIDNLNIKENGLYVDATVGYAGHSKEIIKRVKTGYLYAFDADKEAIEESTKIISEISGNFKLFNENFINMKSMLEKEGVSLVDGIIFDLGVSSPQIDNPDRGFSFMKDGPLDMRMSSKGKSAKDIITNSSEYELREIFYKYGEEKESKKIAHGIYKNKDEINTTLHLVEVIKKSVGANYFYKYHPERKIFQAIRIKVNDELDILERALDDAISLLKPGGRLLVITFHSLEDKIVKHVFKKHSEINEMVKGLPVIPKEYMPLIKLVNKSPVLPTKKEIDINSRSKSAKLRVVERI